MSSPSELPGLSLLSHLHPRRSGYDSALTAGPPVISALAWSPRSGRMLAAALQHLERIVLWCTRDAPLHRAADAWKPSVSLVARSARPSGIVNLAWSPDERALAAVSSAGTVRVWRVPPHDKLSSDLFPDQASPEWSPVAAGDAASCAAWAPDGRFLVVGTRSGRLYVLQREPGAGGGEYVIWNWLDGHKGAITAVVWSHNGLRLASASRDDTTAIWDTTRGGLRCTGSWSHSSVVRSLAWMKDDSVLACGTEDQGISLWEASESRMVRELSGYAGAVTSLSCSADGRRLASQTHDGSVRLWCSRSWKEAGDWDGRPGGHSTAGLAFHPRDPVLATTRETSIEVWQVAVDEAETQASVHQVSAKVLVVGDVGAGKSTLAAYLTSNIQSHPSLADPTVALHQWRVVVGPEERGDSAAAGDSADSASGVRRELVLWDFSSQPGDRRIRELFLGDADAILLVLDSSMLAGQRWGERGLRAWTSTVLAQAGHAPKFLVAAKWDVRDTTLDENGVEALRRELGCERAFMTSTAERQSISDVYRALVSSIPWQLLTPKTEPADVYLSRLIRQYVQSSRAAPPPPEPSAPRLLPTEDILRGIRLDADSRVSKPQVDQALEQLERDGVLYRIDCGQELPLVLLPPAAINQYAHAIMREAERHPGRSGAIELSRISKREFEMHGVNRLERPADELHVIEATLVSLLRSRICFAQNGSLVFPERVTRQQPTPPQSSAAGDAALAVKFPGNVESTYATLVVELWYARRFALTEQWHHAVRFEAPTRGTIELFVRHATGAGEMGVRFDADVCPKECDDFAEFLWKHLRARRLDLTAVATATCAAGHSGTVEWLSDRLEPARCTHCGILVPVPRWMFAKPALPASGPDEFLSEFDDVVPKPPPRGSLADLLAASEEAAKFHERAANRRRRSTS